MNADSSQLLAQLKDIHSAGQPPWWPPAPGWWVLALALLLVLGLVLRQLSKQAAVRRRRKAWLQALDDLNREHDPASQPREYLAGLNRLFRAVALKAFPGTACARLQGKAWVAFIASLMPEHAASDCLDVLATGPYEPLPRFEASSLHDCAHAWVKLYG